MDTERSDAIAEVMSTGRWMHDYPLDLKALRELGLPVSDGLPKEVFALMDLYPAAEARSAIRAIHTDSLRAAGTTT